MPLHDWTDRAGWEGMHHLWISELLRWVKPRLPGGYRAYIGSAPVLAVGSPASRPDVGVRARGDDPQPGVMTAIDNGIEPDVEVAVAAIDPGMALFVERQGRLIAAVELISPRNKDRPVARSTYLGRYLAYLMEAVHLLLIDVHPRPLGFSFADEIAREFSIDRPANPAPSAVSYRVGEPVATGGRLLALWSRPLAVGVDPPTIPLPLTVDLAIPIDLEPSYMRAAEDAYIARRNETAPSARWDRRGGFRKRDRNPISSPGRRSSGASIRGSWGVSGGGRRPSARRGSRRPGWPRGG